jgi:5-methylcytosine-specific restriction endonuclease McrA
MNDSTPPNKFKQLPLFPFKRCTKCKAAYPLSVEFWSKDKRHDDGYSSWCRECDRERYRQYNIQHAQERRDTNQRWRKENRERKLEYNRTWRANNKTRLALYASRYLKKNTEKLNELRRQKLRLNPAKNREAVRQWYLKNYDKHLEKKRRRRARLSGAEGSHTETEVKALFAQQQGLCFHCNCDLEISGFQRDHWIPLIRGGSDWITNIRLLCPFCNMSKGSKLPHEWDNRYKDQSG